MPPLETLFLGAFLFGLIFTVLSVVLGGAHFGSGHHDVHVPHDFHLPHLDGLHGAHGGHVGGQAAGGAHGHAGGSGDGDGSPSMSPFNLTAWTAFIAWFGGAGYLALTGWAVATWLALGVAVVAGLVGWLIVQLFFTRVLLRADRSMDPADYRLEGAVARVSSPLAPGRTGEIQYTLGGVRHSDGARSLDGTPIPRGTEVVIARYERGIAYVQPWETYVEGLPAEEGEGRRTAPAPERHPGGM
jgi:membrane protein implicated in regulation of membrane protease activity